MYIDISEVTDLAAEFEQKANRLAAEVEAVVFKGSMNIKKAWQDNARSSMHFRGKGDQMAASIDFDIKESAADVESEIGPDKDRTGSASLANIWIFGTSRGGGTGRNPQGYLDDETPAFEKYLGEVGADI